MNQTLLPTRILAYIKSDLDDIWRRANITAGALRVALDIDLKPYVVTRSLNEPGKPCEPLWSALQTKKGQEAVAKLFKAPDLFNVGSLPELTELLRRVWPTEDRPAKQVMTPEVVIILRDRVQEGWLATNSATEDLLIQKLAGEVDACRLPLIYWPAPRFCGANFISREILPDLDPSKFEQIIAVSPSNLNKPYEAELSEVRRAFGVDGRDDESLRSLIGKLEESKTLLVVNDYEHFQDEVIEANLSLRRLITLIQRNNLSTRTDHPLILFIGSTDVRGRTVLLDQAHCHKLTNLNHLLSVPRPERFDFFMEQFDLFQAKRWHGHLYDHNGFRTKRARLQLNLKNNREKRPIDIRLRALFASNRDNYAYFDPTGGFMKLVGTLEGGIPRQVQRYVDEVALYLKSKTLGMNQADIRVLRWISTAMYWLTVPAIKEFCRVTSYFDFPRARRILKDDLGDVVQVHPNPESGKEPIMYTAPLGFRAIIQDHWKEEARTYPSRCDRGMTHYIVARRLHGLRHQKVMLNHEFPYEAHWGRSRMYFLSECIRHLVRSVEDVKGFEGQAPKVLEDFPTDVYTRRNGERVQPNPHEVLSICYEKLFQAELNGNTAGSSGSRALSNRHGAYHLTAELLQLMGSHDGLMTPHWAFPESKHAPYYDDVGFAKLDLGELDAAKSAFVRAHSIVRARGRLAEADALLNIALVLTVKGSAPALIEAGHVIESASALIDQEVGPERPDVRNRKVIDLRKRVVSRTAQIYYLQARQLETVRLYDYEFTKYDQRPLRRDMAHILIAALTSIVDEEHVMQQNTERAMQLCVKNLFESTSAGAQHDALGFRIAHAHLLRKKEMIKAADECLDGVHRDIYMYGCSERTYLSFLLEAGRNLLTRKNGPRAYCIYFLPCLERAMARSLTREAQQARGYALQALRQIGQLYDGAPENPDAVSVYIESKISEGTFIETEMRPTVVDAVSQDPLASYDINDNFERVFSLIRSPEAVAAELKRLDDLKLE